MVPDSHPSAAQSRIRPTTSALTAGGLDPGQDEAKHRRGGAELAAGHALD